MTSSNRFTYDVVANDRASETTKKITASVLALTPALEAAAAAYERMAASQAKLGMKNAGMGQQNAMRQMSQLQAQQARADRDSARAESQRVKQANADAQTRANLVARSAAQEIAAIRQLQSVQERTTALIARQTALQQSSGDARRAALQSEIERSQRLVALKKEEVAAAQQAALIAQRTSRTGTGSLGTGAGDAKASAAAVSALRLAHQGLAGAQRDVSVATSALTSEIGKENAALRTGAVLLQENEIRLNTIRYALYQVSAAYAQVARASAAVVKSVVGTAISFEAAFAQLSRTTELGMGIRNGSDTAKQQLQSIYDELTKLSTQIPVTFEDLSKIGSLGAQLGIAATDVASFSETVAKFSATTNVTAEATATYFGRLQNLLDIPTTQFNNLGSAVSELGTNSVATEDEILAVTTQIAAVGTNSGLSAQYVLGLGTAMSSLRIAPELARGATTRIFATITRAAAEGGERLAAFAKVLGVTSVEAARLSETDPEQFFTRLVNSLGMAADKGQNLTLVLDALGIKATRDVNVITRLANGYQLLGQYVGQSFESFQKGTYLNESFKTIEETTQSALKELSGAFLLFSNSIGQTFLAPLKIAADTLNAVFTALSKIPGVITAPILGLIGAVGVLFAFRAALAIVAAALLAMRAAGRNLEGGSVRLGAVLKLLGQTTFNQATAANAAAASTGRHAAAVGGLGAAATRAVPPVGVLTGELRAQAVSAPVAATGIAATATATNALAGSAGRAAVATGALATGFRALNVAIGPVGWVILGIGALIGLFGSLISNQNKAAEAAANLAAEQKKMNDLWQNAGDGASALSEAIQKDTKAYKDATSAGQEAEGVYAKISRSVQTLADGTKVVTSTVEDLRTGLTHNLDPLVKNADGYANFTTAIASATGQAGPAKAGVEGVTSAVIDQTVALGEATQEWKKKALFDQLTAQLSSPELQTAVDQLKDLLPGAIRSGLEGGAAGVTEFFSQTTNALQTKMIELQKIIDDGAKARANAARNSSIGNLVILSQPEVDKAISDLKGLQDQWTVIGTLAEQFAQADSAVEAAAAMDQIKNVVGGALGDITGEFDVAGDAADEFAKKLEDAATSFEESIGRMFVNSDLAGSLTDAFESLGESIANNGVSFDNMTDAGRANLSALSDAVDAYAAIQAQGIRNNEITAEEAAVNTSQFIRDTMAQLSDLGVDTSQLDFLNQYLVSITTTPWTAAINVDTAAAIANVERLYYAILTVQRAQAGMSGASTSGDYYEQKLGSVTKPQPQAQAKAPSAGNGMLGAALSTAKAAQEAKNLASAQDKAARAAKKAGGAAKNAADDASAALKKQQEYVKALAGFYDDLGTRIFSQVKAEGDAFESLQKLGQSIVENGKSFNTFTDLGRKNFDALTSVFNGFGGTLSKQIEQGVLSADQAAQQYREFARGVYGELVGLGVSAQNISGFFRALGVDATGWTGNTGSVQQYAGFITAAAEATGGLTENLKQAEEFSDKLGTALSTAFDRYFGLASSIDKVQSSMNDLSKAYQDSIDKVNELRRANEGLSADLSGAQSERRKAEIEQGISLKYGEVDRAADFGGQAASAGAKVADIQAQITANQKEVATLEAGRNALEGFSAAAITNRAALRDLQQQMLDQIKAYAATGATTQQVEAYTDDLRKQFIATANQAGFTNVAIVGYTGAFNVYAAAVRSVPSSVNTIATANTSQALSALNAIPKSGAHTTVALTDPANYNYVKYQLAMIPKSADYVITPRLSGGGNGSDFGNAIGGAIGSSVASAMSSSLSSQLADPRLYRTIFSAMSAGLANQLNDPRLYRGTAAGGLIKGFSSGGRVPGKQPSNKKRDNVLATGPTGFIGLQSEEYVVQTKAVRKFGVPFFDMLNSGELPGYHRGGSTGGQNSGNWPSVMVAELSPTDRMLLSKIADSGRDISLYSNDQRIATTSQRGNDRLAQRGRN